MHFDFKLLLLLVVALGLMQAVCWLLARGLSRRLERHVMALGLALPVLFLSPWLDRTRLLVPCDLLRKIVPGAPAVPAVPVSDRHELLNDAILQFLPWELEVRHALSDLRLPLWSDVLEGGSSPWVNPQAGVLSPVFLAARIFPIQHFLLAALALKLLVAFEGTWLLARRVGVSRPSSLLAAAGFALGGGLMPWALFPHTAAVVWTPWLACGVVGLFRGGGRRELAVTALLTAFLLLSGHPETAAVGGLFAAICGLSLARRRASFMRGLRAAALAALLGFGLAAPHLLPFALHLPNSQRAHETLAREMPAYRFYLQAPLTWFLPGYGKFMLAPINPRAYGRPYQDEFQGPFNWVDADSGYAGLVAFAGSLVALAAVRRRRAWPFLGFAALSLLLAARFLPLAHVIDAVPPLRAVAYSRFLLVGCLGLAVVGGIGLDRLLFARRRRTLAYAGVAAAATLSLARHADFDVIALWVLLVGGIVVGRWRARAGAAVLGAVLLLDLVPWAHSHLPSGHPGLFYPFSDFVSLVRRETSEGGPWRATGEGQTLFPSVLPVYEVADVRPHNPLAPMPYLETLGAAFGFAPTMLNYFPAFRGIDHPFLDFLNVRTVASTIGFPPPRTLERIDGGRFGPFRLYRNPDALSRWFLPSDIEVIREDQVALWVASLQDPRRVAVFEPRAKGWGSGPKAPAVRLLSSSPGRIALEVAGSGDRLLATSLPGPDGWRATAQGQTLETLTVNGAFLGVHVPDRASRVELRYRPPGFLVGLLFAGMAVLATGWLLKTR